MHRPPPLAPGRRESAAVIVALVAALAPCSGRADFFNSRNVLPGERAAMMGGAYVAVADDIAAAYYNPAGLGSIHGAATSISGTIYAYQVNIRSEYFGDDPRPLVLRLNRLNSLPSAVGVAFQPHPRLALALSLWEIDRVRFAAVAFLDDVPIPVDLGLRSDVFFKSVLRVRLDTSSLLGGPSIAWRVADELAVGASLFVHYFQGVLSVSNEFYNAPGSQVVFDYENDATSGGFAPVVGVLWRPGERWRLGFTWGAETIHVTGRNTYSNGFVATSGLSMLESDTIEGDVRLPHRFALGVAYRFAGGALVTADVLYALPLVYPAPREMLRTAFPENRHVEVGHADASIGLEIPVAPKWTLRGGLYTNTSSASDLYAAARVQGFGATVGVGYYKGGLSTGLGLIIVYGRSDREVDVDAGSTVSWERLHVMVVYGGTHRVLED